MLTSRRCFCLNVNSHGSPSGDNFNPKFYLTATDTYSEPNVGDSHHRDPGASGAPNEPLYSHHSRTDQHALRLSDRLLRLLRRLPGRLLPHRPRVRYYLLPGHVQHDHHLGGPHHCHSSRAHCDRFRHRDSDGQVRKRVVQLCGHCRRRVLPNGVCLRDELYGHRVRDRNC